MNNNKIAALKCNYLPTAVLSNKPLTIIPKTSL
jgi:hypothetical protein